MTTPREEITALSDYIKQQRDEIRLQIHLAKQDVLEDWNELEDKWEKFTQKLHEVSHEAELAGKDVFEATKEVGHQIKESYERIKTKL